MPIRRMRVPIWRRAFATWLCCCDRWRQVRLGYLHGAGGGSSWPAEPYLGQPRCGWLVAGPRCAAVGALICSYPFLCRITAVKTSRWLDLVNLLISTGVSGLCAIRSQFLQGLRRLKCCLTGLNGVAVRHEMADQIGPVMVNDLT